MKKKHSGPQIMAKLRQADVLLGRGKTIAAACKELNINEYTYFPTGQILKRHCHRTN